MPPKTPRTPQTPSSRLNLKVEWKLCASCGSTFVLRDSLRHEAVCSVIANRNFSGNDINHGFILEKRLCAVLEDKGCKDCLQHVQKLNKCHIALVSPSAMQLCGIVIGSHIEIESFDSKSSTFIAWPCSHLPPSSIYIDLESNAKFVSCARNIHLNFSYQVLRVLSMDTQKNLNVKALDEKKNVATSLKLKSLFNSDITVDASQLEQLFLHSFDSHVVKKGTLLILRYLGKKWKLAVEDIVRTDNLKPDERLEAEMGSMTIADDQSPKLDDYFLVLSNTRIYLDTDKDAASVEQSIGLSAFGGGHEVVLEITKLCQGIFAPTSTTAKGMVTISCATST